MARFFLIRHAANDTIGNRFAGRMKGVSLNEEGKQQAEALARLLNGVAFTAVYSSPLERAVETAGPLANARGLDPVLLDELSEIDCGEWTGEDFDKLRCEREFELFNSFRSGTRIPGGELMLEAQVRIVRVLERLAEKHVNQNVAVFTHADPIKGAIAYYAGMSLDLVRRLEISPASVSVLEIDDEDARIMLMNYTGDLEEIT